VPLDRRRFRPRRVSRLSSRPLARRRVVRHSVVPRAFWSPAPDRRSSRTSRRLRYPSASTACRTRGHPGRPAARVGRRGLLTRRRRHLVLGRSRSHQAQGRPVPRGLDRGRKLATLPRLGCQAEPSDQPGPREPLPSPHRPHAHRPDADPRGLERMPIRLVERTARPAKGTTQRPLQQPGRSHLHQTGVGNAAGLPGQGARRRFLPQLPTSHAEPPGPRGNGPAPRHGNATARLGIQWPDLGRWGSCPCATGRRLAGRTPRWGQVEIRLGPAWVRYRGTATPETDPPSTFHRPVLVPGRHRARSSRLRVTLPRCRPSPWSPSAAMPTAPISPARVRLPLDGPQPCVAGIPARQGACSGNRPCAPGPAVLHRVAD
jgi:hypothetical protein